MSDSILSQNPTPDNGPQPNNLPTAGLPFTQAECLRIFFYHLDRLNALARAIQEAPINAEQTPQFYNLCYDAMSSCNTLDKLSWLLPFDHALRSLADREAWDAAEDVKAKEASAHWERKEKAAPPKPEPAPEPELTREQIQAFSLKYILRLAELLEVTL